MKKIPMILAISLVLMAAVACTLDYRLNFKVESWTYNNSYCTVNYTIVNTGNKTLYDIELGITVYYTDSNGQQYMDTTAYCGNLQAFEDKKGSVDVYIGSGCTVTNVVITSTGWNDSDDNNDSIFD